MRQEQRQKLKGEWHEGGVLRVRQVQDPGQSITAGPELSFGPGGAEELNRPGHLTG